MSLHRTKEQKVAIFVDAFRGRTDIHGTRDRDSGQARCEKSPPTLSLITQHLCGKRPIGIYPLVEDRAWFAAIDLDEMDTEPVMALQQLATGLGLEPLIERSKSKGWHLWFFADESGWEARLIRQLLRWMTAEINLPGVEVFPKQDRIEPSGFGNFIYLPLDGLLVPKGRTLFVEPTRWLPPVTNQWDALADRKRYSETQIVEALTSIGLHGESSAGYHRTPNEQVSCSPRERAPGQKNVVTSSDKFGDGSRRHLPDPSRGLPPCAQRMLAEGVTEQQRVACFRLAVHLHRVGLPEDLARGVLIEWSKKNRPEQGKRIITEDEITQQTRDGYSGRYRGYGCEDPAVAQYCQGQCPIASRSQSRTTHRPATNRTVRPLQG